MTPRPRLWRVQRGVGPREWEHRTVDVLRLGPLVVSLSWWRRREDWMDGAWE